MTAEYLETVWDGWDQRLTMDEPLYEAKTGFQHLVIFRNRLLGRVMALDGVVQTTEADEFVYHEMMAHVPILAHGGVRRVLIIGGGDGGLLREVLRHRDVQQAFLVEIDAAVVDVSRTFLPRHSSGAFDDARTTIVIDDGMRFLHRTDLRFDVILTDSTDPEGPGERLFSRAYYAACKQRLTPGGVLVTQNGVPFLQLSAVRATAEQFKAHFRDWHFYTAAVPTYTGGIMAFGWASDNPDLRRQAGRVLARRFQQSGITTRYYTPDLHRGAFALPQFILDAIGKPAL